MKMFKGYPDHINNFKTLIKEEKYDPTAIVEQFQIDATQLKTSWRVLVIEYEDRLQTIVTSSRKQQYGENSIILYLIFFH